MIDHWRTHFPGGELIWQGLLDVAAGRFTIAACLVAIGRTRLIDSGLLSAAAVVPGPDPELRLYGLLREMEGDAYSRYNALLRELCSFHAALDRSSRRGFRVQSENAE